MKTELPAEQAYLMMLSIKDAADEVIEDIKRETDLTTGEATDVLREHLVLADRISGMAAGVIHIVENGAEDTITLSDEDIGQLTQFQEYVKERIAELSEPDQDDFPSF